jgi:hypothetical protein
MTLMDEIQGRGPTVWRTGRRAARDAVARNVKSRKGDLSNPNQRPRDDDKNPLQVVLNNDFRRRRQSENL